ncbi:MAG: hypothetical protein R3236_10930, partial [Phycisphaeraceae bacterium]|nr:hypothetical protein [Phycisphaeraceae bacterium]
MRFLRHQPKMFVRLAAGLMLWTMAACCVPRPPVTDDGGPLLDAEISYQQLRDRHNRRTGRIRTLWAKVRAQAQWHEPDGQRRFEQGDD